MLRPAMPGAYGTGAFPTSAGGRTAWPRRCRSPTMPSMTAYSLSSSDVDVARPALLPKPAVMARDWAYLVTGLPAGIVTFTVIVTGLSLAAGLAITLIGIPVLLATLYLGRWMADVEQLRAGWVLDAPYHRHRRVWRGGLWTRFKAAVSDAGAWRDQLWSLVLLPVGIAGFTAAVTLWSAALGMLTSPLWYWAASDDSNDTIPLLDSTSPGWSALRVLIGIALVPIAAWGCRALAYGTGRAAKATLGD
jgi:hypothetical protein